MRTGTDVRQARFLDEEWRVRSYIKLQYNDSIIYYYPANLSLPCSLIYTSGTSGSLVWYDTLRVYVSYQVHT